MPKSSTDSRTPISFNVRRSTRVRSSSLSITRSVTSSISAEGLSSCSVSRRRTCAGTSSEWKRSGDTLTDMLATGTPSRCHAASCAQAVSSTHASIAPIRPHSSASAMKRSGGTWPRVGSFQRTSASTPAQPLPSRCILGW